MGNRPLLIHTLQRLAKIEPRPEAAQKAIEHARLAIIIRPSDHHNTPLRRKPKLPKKILLTVVSIAIVLLLVFWLDIFGNSRNCAFADFQNQIRQIKTVQYIETRTDKSKIQDRILEGPTIETRVMILGRYLKRSEMKIIKQGEQLEDGAEWATVPECILIEDLEKGIFLTLDIKKKVFGFSKATLSVNENGTIQATENKPHPEVDFYEQIRKVPTEKAEKLPEKIIDGKKAIGFRVTNEYKNKQGVDTFIITYWIDPQTKLPIQIESSFNSTNPFMGQGSAVQNNFIFDDPLDSSLFSTDPPDGYTDPSQTLQKDSSPTMQLE